MRLLGFYNWPSAICSLLTLLAAGAFTLCHADALQPQSDAERYVLECVQNGQAADLAERFPGDDAKPLRQVRGEFLKQLLTTRDPKSTTPAIISITKAVVPDEFDLKGADVPYDVFFLECEFQGNLAFDNSHFRKSLQLIGSNSKLRIKMNQATVDQSVYVANYDLGTAHFAGVHVGRDFLIGGSIISDPHPDFKSAKIEGKFSLADCRFHLFQVDLQYMQVNGAFSLQHTEFFGVMPQGLGGPLNEYPKITLAGGHFGDLFFNDSHFENVSVVDLTGVETSSISFDKMTLPPQTRVLHQRLSYKLISPVRVEQLGFLLSPYDAQSYVDLENSFRAQGYAAEADEVFIAGKRAERRRGRRCRRDRPGRFRNRLSVQSAGTGPRGGG